MTDSVENFLEHYGVPGMKWGRRKSSSGSSVTTTTEHHLAPAHDDAVKAKTAKAKAKNSGLDSLSNQEIQSYVTRANLEQQYAKLNPAKTSSGKKFATDLLTNTGKGLASQYAQQYAKKGIEAVVKAAVSK